ncbi:class I SAM-dependent methyltransferase [Flavihumibacter solisilvae]|uniref:Methyltransferase domain-containing protein n=1 Tax=Flavihumibacter solisilvae TaxID=1349421 RepID=A0A0C1ITI3_9BACT|nr:methyltransferase domain-containing protein [Flavihumibacter solisilvae]KIC93759.1 hypothetical protein OI18_15430 [Flavihumibacter solisilvae]
MFETNNSFVGHESRAAFKQLYLQLRQQEQRLYSDDELRELPDIHSGHIHYHEWKIRRQSSLRLAKYLMRKKSPIQILEIGCGNGWLAARLAGIEGSTVTAIDINGEEIRQAKRVFHKTNLDFREMDFDPEGFPGTAFDIVVFAASLQYFSPLKSILDNVLKCMADDGEIHILDTHFYKASELADAANRSCNYYTGRGYPAMAEYYFHHQIQELDGLNYKIMYNPQNLLNRLFVRNPFYWICVYQ